VRVNLTRKGGGVRFAIRPLVTAKYELVYHGNATLAAAHSSSRTPYSRHAAGSGW
jgi:hypothetical protein